jgi:hypothetical protein
MDAYGKIFRKEGYRGFYSGLTPNILRCSIMNSTELASYDEIKTQIVIRFKVDPDTKLLHFVCASIASFLAVIFSSPVDVMKTRMMNVIISLMAV